jgi:hypothetical protein
MTVSTDSSDVVVIAARASSAAYPSSPTERLIFADTRVNVHSRATLSDQPPWRRTHRARASGERSHASSPSPMLGSTSRCTLLCAAEIAYHRVLVGSAAEPSHERVNDGVLRLDEAAGATGRRPGASTPRSAVACATPASP